MTMTRKTIVENGFEQAVPPIAMNKINAKWKQEANQSWESYQDFWTNKLPAAFRDHGVKEQQLASCMTAMEANMEGIQSEQQAIQNGFHEFGSEVIKGFAVDTGLIAGASQNDTLIAQLKAEMAKQQADVASKLNTIMAALGNQSPTPAPSPAPSPTQQTAPTTGTNNQGVMNGTGVIDTTLNDPDYKNRKNRGSGTTNHDKKWRQYWSYCPDKGINLKCNDNRCQEFCQKCHTYPEFQRNATYNDEKGGSEALNLRWMTWIGPDGQWWKTKEDYFMFYNGPNGACS